jgi:hypothetical protein
MSLWCEVNGSRIAIVSPRLRGILEFGVGCVFGVNIAVILSHYCCIYTIEVAWAIIAICPHLFAKVPS